MHLEKPFSQVQFKQFKNGFNNFFQKSFSKAIKLLNIYMKARFIYSNILVVIIFLIGQQMQSPILSQLHLFFSQHIISEIHFNNSTNLFKQLLQQLLIDSQQLII